MADETEDDVLLRTARLVVGISVRAADTITEASLVQLRALTVLNDAVQANLVQLADGMGVTVSTTSRLVDRLMTAGLVDRQPSQLTRREVSISLTDAGRAVLRRYDDLRVDALRSRLDQLGPGRRQTVLEALQGLLDAGTAPRHGA
jgi:DNA-binding MarR family transcriptional regulator